MEQDVMMVGHSSLYHLQIKHKLIVVQSIDISVLYTIYIIYYIY